MKALYYNAILGILLSFPSFLKAQIRPFEPLNPDRIFFKGSNGNFYIDAKPKETLYFTYAGKEENTFILPIYLL